MKNLPDTVMDLTLLGMKLKDDQLTYKNEYLEELRSFEALLRLASPPPKQMRPLLTFVIRNCHVDASRSITLLTSALAAVKDVKIRRTILGGLILARQKRLIESKDLFRLVLEYGSDLRFYLKGCQEFLEMECYDVLTEWYRKGVEKQKSFCYYFLLILFSRAEKKSAALEEGGEESAKTEGIPKIGEKENEAFLLEIEPEENCRKIKKRRVQRESESNESNRESNGCEDFSDSDDCYESNDVDGCNRNSGCKDFNGDADLSNAETAKNVCIAVCKNEPMYFKSDFQRAELESLICEAFFGTSKISKVCMLYFLNRTEVKFDISKVLNGFEYAKRVFTEVSETHMDRDVKIRKLRIFVLFKKHFKMRSSITNIVLKMIDLEKEDLGELLDCLVESVERRETAAVMKVLSDEFVNEKKDDDIICYGMNVMREIYYRLAGLEKVKILQINDEFDADSISSDKEEFSCDAENTDASDDQDIEKTSSCEDLFIKDLKEMILGYIAIFRGNRTKSIHYSYKALVKAVVKGETIDRPTTFILKSRTKEEREKLRKKKRRKQRERLPRNNGSVNKRETEKEG